MSSTVFTNGVTLTDADWFNDVNRLHYTILADPADMAALKNTLLPLSAEQATTSGSSVSFSIPSSAKLIIMNLNGVSSNGTVNPLIQIGDTDGLENTGYSSNSARLTDSAAVSVAAYTTGFGINSANAGNLLYGSVFISLVNAASFTWNASGNLNTKTGAVTCVAVSGSKSLSAALDKVAFITTDTLDAGAISVLYF